MLKSALILAVIAALAALGFFSSLKTAPQYTPDVPYGTYG